MTYAHIADSLAARLLKIEQGLIEQFSSEKTIEHALLLGHPNQSDLLQHCRGQYRHLLCENYPKSRSHTLQLCLGQFIDLPYAKESLDFIILPHILESSPDYQTILDEVAECLSPRGTLLIFSSSPWSNRFSQLNKTDDSAYFAPLSAHKIKRLLSKIGLKTIASQSFFSVLSTLKNSKLIEILDKTIMPYLPFFCHAYLIVAQKNTTSSAHISLKSYFTPHHAISLDNACAARTGNA